MNTQRLVVLGFALVAAGGAALLVRGMLGGGTPSRSQTAPAIAMSEVLVANANLDAGPGAHRRSSALGEMADSTVDPSFITHDAAGSEEQVVKGTVVRALILPGQPITNTAIVHGDASGFMAATLGDRHARDFHYHLRRFRRRRVHPAQ